MLTHTIVILASINKYYKRQFQQKYIETNKKSKWLARNYQIMINSPKEQKTKERQLTKNKFKTWFMAKETKMNKMKF